MVTGMCDSTEAIITAVYHRASGQWDLWLTETDNRGQVELLANAQQAHIDLVNQFGRLRNALLLDHSFVDPEKTDG